MSDGTQAPLPRWWAAPRTRQALQSIGLAVSMAVITTLAVKVFGWQSWRWRSRAPSVLVAPASPRRADLSHDQRLVPVSPEPEPSEAPQKKTPSVPEARHQSAKEMFDAAKLARTRGDAPQAIRMSQQIEEFFPNSEEGINTHLALGVLYLEQHQASLALQEFGTFRLVGSPELMAEALWGQAQALRQLGRTQDEQIVLEELLRSYPRSVYVAASKKRLAELPPHAAGH
jgi:tetratricopeptide (TPR) repeat protein